ncbi:hypothetical protein ANN_23802 [Periplaneta americana]|uniref:DUF4817 domain-containing protein n=1 Tax=Periplaneta americana TaxID=6978 RepID=A0ABQ8SM25_PERAM|nr:hypothetical protein ANN_23802 [Periplaneta americana]
MLKMASNFPGSLHTVRRRFRERDIRCLRAVKREHLTMEHAVDRLAMNGHRYDERFMIRLNRSGRVSVASWRWMSYDGAGLLERIHGQRYQGSVCDQALTGCYESILRAAAVNKKGAECYVWLASRNSGALCGVATVAISRGNDCVCEYETLTNTGKMLKGDIQFNWTLVFVTMGVMCSWIVGISGLSVACLLSLLVLVITEFWDVQALRPDITCLQRDAQLSWTLIFVAASVVCSWLLGTTGLSMAWLLLLLALVAAVWKASLVRLVEAAINYETLRVRRRRALSQDETAEWFNFLVNRWSLPSKETLRGHSDSSFRGEGYIQCCVGVRLCDMYSNQELAEIHFMYGRADGNAALARRLYQERYPQRQCPDRKTLVRLHYRLCEYGKI